MLGRSPKSHIACRQWDLNPDRLTLEPCSPGLRQGPCSLPKIFRASASTQPLGDSEAGMVEMITPSL